MGIDPTHGPAQAAAASSVWSVEASPGGLVATPLGLRASAAINIRLATPDAARWFDPSALDDAGRVAWHGIRTARRRLDWASSRALLRSVPTGCGESRSLSHSHGFSTLVVAPRSVSVGVDVERLVERDFLRIAETAYSNIEADYLATLEHKDLMSTFYECWTLKEACAKALRLPLWEALASCSMIDVDGRLAPVVSVTRPWRAMIFAPRADLRLAMVCVTDEQGLLHDGPATAEWPSPKASEWPIVLDVTSGPAWRSTGHPRSRAEGP